MKPIEHIQKYTYHHVTEIATILEYWKDEKDVLIEYAADTETDGLLIRSSKPFLMIFGWSLPVGGRVFTFEPTPQNLLQLIAWMGALSKKVWFHNTKYDMHMIRNLLGEAYPEDRIMEMFDKIKWADTMIALRLSYEALSEREGGMTLGLKAFATNFISPTANAEEGRISAVRKSLKDKNVKVLTALLKGFDMKDEFTATGKPKKWGKGAIEKFLKDITSEITELPQEIRDIWFAWKREYGTDPTYLDAYHADPESMIKYAGKDVAYTLEAVRFAMPTIQEREQQKILKMEEDTILPVFRMESVGLKLDMDYLEESRVRVREHILRQRQALTEASGEVVTPNQHKRIIEIFDERFNIILDSADKSTMKQILKNQKAPQEAKDMAQAIIALRTAEKWYGTYIVRIQNKGYMEGGRFYTQLNQSGAISGRFSGDSQQFPKDSLTDEDGTELYHPRNAFIVDDGYSFVYIDQSQVELRVQAHYTVALNQPDINLCRSYMPFDCTHAVSGKVYDVSANKMNWDAKHNESSVWLMEDGTPWTPTDTHSLTTHTSLMLMGYKCVKQYNEYVWEKDGKAPMGIIDSPKSFAKARYTGKMVNFMRNYGGGIGAFVDSLDITEDVAQAMLEGWSAAYPGVAFYAEMIVKGFQKNGYVKNTYGRRYYIQNGDKAYKLGNYVIQGTCADMMKEAIRKADTWIAKNAPQVKQILTIHDELQYLVPNDMYWVIPELQKVLESNDYHVPILADVEISRTNWREKENYEYEIKTSEA